MLSKINMNNSKYHNDLFERATATNASILIPESEDNRVIVAKNKLRSIGINILEVDDFTDNSKYINYIQSKKFTDNWPNNEIEKYIENPINKAFAILACNDVDGVIAGATISTADVIRGALRTVGIDPAYKWISSSFIMISPDKKNILTYSDCAVIPEPTSEQLVYIAKAASDIHKLVTGQNPKVAFLSFSTNGSANHYRVGRVQEAVNLFSRKFPNIKHEGELQFDAAISKEIAIKKNMNSELKGDANVFIFPNLDAGNISYKITRQLAGYSAWGPLVQGLKKPVHDLSRSCSADDIINIAAITSIQKSS